MRALELDVFEELSDTEPKTILRIASEIGYSEKSVRKVLKRFIADEMAFIYDENVGCTQPKSYLKGCKREIVVQEVKIQKSNWWGPYPQLGEI